MSVSIRQAIKLHEMLELDIDKPDANKPMLAFIGVVLLELTERVVALEKKQSNECSHAVKLSP